MTETSDMAKVLEEREQETNRLIENFLKKPLLNTGTREEAKRLIMFSLRPGDPTEHKEQIISIVRKLKEVGIKEDTEWISKNVPQYYQ